MLCNFQKLDNDDKPWRCVNCGYKCRVNAKRGCSKPQETHAQNIGPSFTTKVTNFGKAIVKDIANGMQRCTDEEINRRLNICKECPFYIKKDEESGSCSKCGCVMSRDRVYLNKVYWESEHCPDNPPRW